jgi:fibronectin-binding autotransporter adhesin
MRKPLQKRKLVQALAACLTAQAMLAGPAAAQTVTYSDGQVQTAPIQLSTSTTLDVETGTATQAGAISETSPSAITKVGAGTLILTGDNSYSGSTYLDAGSLVLGNVDALGTGRIILQDGTSILVDVSGTIRNPLQPFGSNTTLSVSHGQDLTWTSLTILSGTLHIGSAGNDGSVTATSSSGYAAGTTLSVDYGLFRSANLVASGGYSPIPTLNVGAAGTYDLNGITTVANSLTGSGLILNNGSGAAVLTMQAGSGNFSGVIEDGAAQTGLSVHGGNLVLTGANTYTGGTTISSYTNGTNTTAGTLQIGNGGTTGNAGAGNVIVFASTSTLSFNRSNTFNFTGTLSGPGTIAQIGTGTTVLTSASNSIGSTTVSAGTLQVNGGLTSGAVTVGAGTLQVQAGGTLTAPPVSPQCKAAPRLAAMARSVAT